jgi:hypothetical protein
MSKSNNQSNFLDNIKFVQDITPETAANYSGGAGRLNGAANDPDVIVYRDTNFRGDSLNLNAAIGDGLSNIGTRNGNGGGGDNGFNDQISSIKILRGTWAFYSASNFGNTRESGQTVQNLGPGPAEYKTLPRLQDSITSAKRIG